MALSSNIESKIEIGLSPEDTTPSDLKHNPLFADTGNGEEQKKNADSVFANATDPSTAMQSQLYSFGYNARNNMNKDAYAEARKDGYERNFQEGKNLPIDSAHANWNNMSWDETQRLARLADAYNSGKHWQRGKISLDGTGADSRYVQNTPIETQEMRRNQLTQQGLAQQQSYALGRANDILAYPQKLTEAFDRMGMDADAAAMEIQRNFVDYAQRAQYDEQFRAEYEQALQKGLMYWSQEMMQYQNSKVAAVLYNEMVNNPQYAQWVAANLVNAPLPSQQQYLENMITSQIMRSGLAEGKKREDVLSEVTAVIGRLTGGVAYQEQLVGGYVAGQAGRGSLGGAYSAVTGNSFLNQGR